MKMGKDLVDRAILENQAEMEEEATKVLKAVLNGLDRTEKSLKRQTEHYGWLKDQPIDVIARQ